MARSSSASNANRHRRHSSDDADDDDDRGHNSHRKDDDGRGHDSHRKHESCNSDRNDRGRRDDDRYEFDLDLDKRRDGIDLDIDIERDGRWLDVEIEIGSLDFDLKLDARHLQADSSPVASLVGGDGTAVGEQTLVDADIFSRLIDLGSVTVAFGAATFKSAAVSGEDLAFAAADTFADVSGADFVFVFNKKVSITSDGETSYATQTSTTTYIAIDFEDFDFSEGPIAFNFYDANTYLDGCRGGRVPNIDGNVSVLDVDALARAENTLVDVLSSILTIEDQLSSVSAVAVSAVG
jgi:hypothetical protein